VRLRVPGGQITSRAMRALAGICEKHGDGSIHLTSRGNVQLRGVAMAGGGCTWELVDAVKAAGLLPSESHELVRNIVASPLTGLAGGLMDVRPVVRALDAGLLAVPSMAGLPGRFLFVVDDGRGDVAGMKADLTLVATSSDTFSLVGGPDLPRSQVVREVVAACRRFLELRDKEWHIDELGPEGAAQVRGHVQSLVSTDAHSASAPFTARPPVVGQVLAPLGRLSADQLRLLADSAPQLVITPWRGVVVPGVGEDLQAAFEDAGLVTRPGSPWARITACVGRPSCAKAMGDTMAAARRLAAAEPGLEKRVHLVACERACGTPSGQHELILVQE